MVESLRPVGRVFSDSRGHPCSCRSPLSRYPSRCCCCSVLLFSSAVRSGMAGHNPAQATRPSPPTRGCRSEGRAIATAPSVVCLFQHRERAGLFPAQARQGPAIVQRFWMSRASFSLSWLLLRFSVLSDRQQTSVPFYLAAVQHV